MGNIINKIFLDVEGLRDAIYKQVIGVHQILDFRIGSFQLDWFFKVLAVSVLDLFDYIHDWLVSDIAQEP